MSEYPEPSDDLKARFNNEVRLTRLQRDPKTGEIWQSSLSLDTWGWEDSFGRLWQRTQAPNSALSNPTYEHSKDINPWLPEPDLLTHQLIGKLGEEASETSGRCCRILIQGIKDKDPKSGRTNREELADELDDIEAVVYTIRQELGIPPNSERQRKKASGFVVWMRSIGIGV